MEVRFNTESLEALIATFVTQREALAASAADLQGKLEAAEWSGPRATEFRALWSEQYAPALSNIVTSLETYQSDVQRQLDNYRANEGG